MRKGLCLVCCAAFTACGDDDGVSTSGVNADALIVNLSEQELRTLCTWVVEYESKSSAASVCTAIAAMNTETKAECEESRTMCIAEREPASQQRLSERRALCANLSAGQPRENCSSTVRDLERCVRESVDGFIYYVRGYSCAKARQFLGDHYPSDSCDAVNGTCFPLPLSG